SKWGSRGKIQERKVQGRMASWSSHRQTVDPEIEATMPWRITSFWMSGTNSREAGSSRVLGSSQATALTAITTSGGKNPRPTLPGGLLQSLQALLEEALAPLAHDLAGTGPPWRRSPRSRDLGRHTAPPSQ